MHINRVNQANMLVTNEITLYPSATFAIKIIPCKILHFSKITRGETRGHSFLSRMASVSANFHRTEKSVTAP